MDSEGRMDVPDEAPKVKPPSLAGCENVESGDESDTDSAGLALEDEPKENDAGAGADGVDAGAVETPNLIPPETADGSAPVPAELEPGFEVSQETHFRSASLFLIMQVGHAHFSLSSTAGALTPAAAQLNPPAGFDDSAT